MQITVQAAPIATVKCHSEYVKSISFSHDGKTIAVSGNDYDVILVDVKSKKKLKSLKHPYHTIFHAFSPDDSVLAVAGISSEKQPPDDKGRVYRKGRLYLWNMKTKKLLWQKELDRHVSGLEFLPSGILLITIGGKLSFWDVKNRKILREIKTHKTWSIHMAVSKNGRYAVTGGYKDRLVKVWDVARCKKVLTIEGHKGQLASFTISPDGNLIASACKYSRYPMLKITSRTGSETHTYQMDKKFKFAVWLVRQLSFSPDNKYLAIVPEIPHIVYLFDYKSKTLNPVCKEHFGKVKIVAWSPDGKLFVTGGIEGKIKIWETKELLKEK